MCLVDRFSAKDWRGAVNSKITALGFVAIISWATIPAWATGILGPSDPVIAVDLDILDSNSAYPAGEAPRNVLDDVSATKYLNFGKLRTGVIVTPAFGASRVQSFVLTTANDSAERDPTSWELDGTNDLVGSPDDSQGMDENWTLIVAGMIDLPTIRLTDGPMVVVPNDVAYSSFRMVFPTLRNAAAVDSMQVGDIQFFNVVPEPPGSLR